MTYAQKTLEFASKPLHQLIGLQALLIIVGITYWEFSVTWLDVLSAIAAAVATEFVMSRKIFFPASAIAAAHGIGIFFRAAHPAYFVLAGCLAILAKHLIKGKDGAHIFNPSNVSVLLLAIALPSTATIEFTQWGSNVYEYAIVAALAFIVAYRAGVLFTTVPFLAAYAILLLALLPFYPDAISVHHFGLLGPSVVLFACFMITDPRTAPTLSRARILHGISVAVFFFALEIMGVRYAIFLASFLITIFNLLWRTDMWSRVRPAVFGSFPANAPTLLAVSGVLVAAALAVPPAATSLQYSRLSLDFMLRGVESNELLRCGPDAPLVASKGAGFATGTHTYGAAWGDYDDDGFEDLFVSNIGKDTSRLYRNKGDGTFEDVTETVGIRPERSSSAVFVDYDGDGLLDLFLALQGGASPSLTRYQQASLRSPSITVYRNMGGTFSDMTARIGLRDFELHNRIGGAFSFADYDRDGDLDFTYVSSSYAFPAFRTEAPQIKSALDPRFNYSTIVTCDAEEVSDIFRSLGSRALGTQKDIDLFAASGGCLSVNATLEMFAFSRVAWKPTTDLIDVIGFLPGSAHIFENVGGKYSEHQNFEELLLEDVRTSGYSVRHYEKTDGVSRHYFQPISFDFDQDGDQDIVITVGWGTNIAVRNDGDFTFKNVTTGAGLDYGGSGMGIAVGDYDKDGVFDAGITNVLGDYIFRGAEDGRFALAAEKVGTLGLGWGISFVDYDLDGNEDLYVVNGDVPRTVSEFDTRLGRTLYRTDRLYKNTGATFEDVTWTDVCPDGQSGKVSTVADYDNDGDPDIFVGTIVAGSSNGDDILLENRQGGNSYVKVRLRGSRSNTFGVGSVVRVYDGESAQSKAVMAGSGYYAGDSLKILFGLGTRSTPVDIEVLWPSGAVSRLRNVEINREVTVYEP